MSNNEPTTDETNQATAEAQDESDTAPSSSATVEESKKKAEKEGGKDATGDTEDTEEKKEAPAKAAASKGNKKDKKKDKDDDDASESSEDSLRTRSRAAMLVKGASRSFRKILGGQLGLSKKNKAASMSRLDNRKVLLQKKARSLRGVGTTKRKQPMLRRIPDANEPENED